MDTSVDIISICGCDVPKQVLLKAIEINLCEKHEQIQFAQLYSWFLRQKVLSKHALNYCVASVDTLGTVDMVELAEAVLHRVDCEGNPLVSLQKHLQVTILDENKLIRGFTSLLMEARQSSKDISRQVSDTTASTLFSVSSSDKSPSSPPFIPRSSLSESVAVTIPLQDALLATVASPATIRTRLAYLFAYPTYRHCFSSTLLLRGHAAQLHDDHQGQGLTGLLLAAHCGKRFYTQDAGLFQHLPRLRSVSFGQTQEENARKANIRLQEDKNLREQYRNHKYHPYYQSYDSDEPDRMVMEEVPTSRTHGTDETKSLPPDGRCCASEVDAMRLLSRTVNPFAVDVGVSALIHHIQTYQNPSNVRSRAVSPSHTHLGCLNEVGAIVRSPTEDIVGVFYYWQPNDRIPALPGRELSSVRQQAKEVALQFGLPLYHLRVRHTTTSSRDTAVDVQEEEGVFGAQWTEDIDSV